MQAERQSNLMKMLSNVSEKRPAGAARGLRAVREARDKSWTRCPGKRRHQA